MKTVKFTSETIPVTEAVFDGGRAELRFRSGKTYVVSAKNYVDGVKKQMRALLEGDFDRKGLEEAVLKEANEKLKKDAEYRRQKYCDKIGGVIIEIEDPDAERNPAAEDDDELKNFELFCETMSSRDDGRLIGEDFQFNFMNYANGTFMKQNFSGFSRESELDWVLVETADETYQKAYFYTRHETKNGFEIWYKAYDPIIWFGVEKEEKGK